MNTNTISNLFTGAFYIDSMYAQSCIPNLYNDLVGKNQNREKSLNDLTNTLTSEVISTENTSGPQKVIVLNFNQPVVKYRYYDWLGTQDYMAILNQYANDPDVAGIVLNIDSGGGQVYGTGEFYDYLMNYPKPYVAFTHGYMCSGAYYMAAPAKHIVANKRADAIGSIGVYSTMVDFNGLWEKFGAKVHTMYATKSTSKNADYREVIENGNHEPYIKNQLDPIVEDFVTDMKEARPQLSDVVFEGGTWTGKESVALGLIDETGTLQTAINKVFELSQTNKSKNSNNMSKQRANVQDVLGLETPLASTENGSYLNDEQLDTLEAHIETQTTANATLQSQLDAATANTDLNDQLATANANLTNAETEVDAMLTQAGLEATGTFTEKLTALNGKVTEMSKADGAKPTVVKIDGATPKKAASVSIDANASHNQIANQIHN